MPLTQVRFENNTGNPVTFKLDLKGAGGSPTITRLVNPGATPIEPVDPRLGIFEIAKTSEITGVALPSKLVLANAINDPGLDMGLAKANNPAHGVQEVDLDGGGKLMEDYLPPIPIARAAPKTDEADEEQPPRAPN
jgi:hypothetical protein